MQRSSWSRWNHPSFRRHGRLVVHANHRSGSFPSVCFARRVKVCLSTSDIGEPTLKIYGGPFRCVHIDTQSVRPMPSRGNCHTLRAICPFIGYAWAIALTSLDATEIAEALANHVFLDVAGFVPILRSNRGGFVKI